MGTRSRAAGAVLAPAFALALTGASAIPAAAAPPTRIAAPAPSPSYSPPAPVDCPSDLGPFVAAYSIANEQTVRDRSPAPAPTSTALPAPASTTGGERLAQPGRQVQLPAGAPAPPVIRASAWLVADLDTGGVLASCNAHIPLPPASTLKTLTALALWPVVKQDVVYTATAQDEGIDGTRAGLVAGSRYTGDNLWHGLLMSSANDCASALASIAGGLPAATARMQETARALGAADTVPLNTSGLDATGQVSSAYDLALFGRAMLKNPEIMAVARTRDYPFPNKGTGLHGEDKRTSYQIQNHNKLLYNYPGATGVKNGYTIAAGGSFVGSATRNGHSYIVTMLRADTNTWRATASLLDWAFAVGPAATPVGTLNAPPVTAAQQTTAEEPAATTAPAPGQTTPAQAAPVQPGAGTDGVVAAAATARPASDGTTQTTLARVGIVGLLVAGAAWLGRSVRSGSGPSGRRGPSGRGRSGRPRRS